MRPSSPDASSPSMLAAIAVVGRDADQTSDLTPVELAQLRQVDDQGLADGGPDARRSLQQRQFFQRHSALLEQLGNPLFQLVDLLVKRLEQGFDALDHGPTVDLLSAVFLSG